MKENIFPEYPVEDLHAHVREYFGRVAVPVWKSITHTGRRRSNQVKKGLTDWMGHTRMGVAVYCEVKKMGDKLSQDQIDFLNDASKCGCFCYMCYQLKGTPIILERWESYKAKHLNKQ